MINNVGGMLAAVGDLVDDIVVRFDGAVHLGSDTDAAVERRRGGSAANVAVTAAELSGGARLLAQVGDDPAGRALSDELLRQRVDVGFVRRQGRTGSIVVLVDASGERSFFTDPGSARQLSDPQPEWLDGIDLLHVPLYSLAGGAIASTSATLIEWAYQRGIAVSIDLSSVSVIERLGPANVRSRLAVLAPTIVFANSDEAASVGVDRLATGAIVIVKHGALPAVVRLTDGTSHEVPASDLLVSDSTGAGDAFAAGVLSYDGWQGDPVAACAAGHDAARRLLLSR
jgi:sugar/nucleoside kinase (ribokinase family)